MRTLTFNRVIGAGNMGTCITQVAGSRRFCRLCAVKVIQDGGPDREHFVSRMRDEARLLGMLQDEQILGVSELVMVAGRDAVIMEYVDGIDLSDLVDQHTAIPPRALANWSRDGWNAASGHTALHPSTNEPLNVIHRDIKPANVMLTTRGGVRLLTLVSHERCFRVESETQGLVLGTLITSHPRYWQVVTIYVRRCVWFRCHTLGMCNG